MNRKGGKVLICAGGSGGHIFPAIALARKLKKLDDGVRIKFVGSDKVLDRRIFEREGFDYLLLSANSLPNGLSPALIPSFLKFLLDFLRSILLLCAYRPGVVIGFGGYVSFPVMLGAGMLAIPRIAHEQNVTPGRSNRLLFKIADKIAVSFEDTKRFLGNQSRKAVFTGNPIRTEDFQDNRLLGMRRFGLDPARFTILVIGGSQGARFLNRTFVEALEELDDRVLASIQVIHITGVKDYEWALKAYEGTGVEFRVHSFVDRIEDAYSASDLIITRSGASAIFEIAFFARPMILVPYRFAMSHQTENARAFVDRNAAILMEEDALTPKIFSDKIMHLFNNREELKSISEAARRLSVPGASEFLAREAMSLIKAA